MAVRDAYPEMLEVLVILIANMSGKGSSVTPTMDN